jgi:hypothetical protein
MSEIFLIQPSQHRRNLGGGGVAPFQYFFYIRICAFGVRVWGNVYMYIKDWLKRIFLCFELHSFVKLPIPMVDPPPRVISQETPLFPSTDISPECSNL